MSVTGGGGGSVGSGVGASCVSAWAAASGVAAVSGVAVGSGVGVGGRGVRVGGGGSGVGVARTILVAVGPSGAAVALASGDALEGPSPVPDGPQPATPINNVKMAAAISSFFTVCHLFSLVAAQSTHMGSNREKYFDKLLLWNTTLVTCGAECLGPGPWERFVSALLSESSFGIITSL